MENVKIDLIIPAYHPGKAFEILIKRLEEQEVKPDRILVMNTEKEFWNPAWEKLSDRLEVRHLKKRISTMAEQDGRRRLFPRRISWFL